MLRAAKMEELTAILNDIRQQYANGTLGAGPQTQGEEATPVIATD